MRTALDILQQVAAVLVSQQVVTTIAEAVASGVQTVTPGSMAGIYVGARLVIDYQGAAAEQVAVTAITATTFTANFANAHAAGVSVQAPTFPEGYPDGQLFAQAPEMLQYVADAQNEFLLATRPVFAQAEVAVTGGLQFAAAPADAIRIERVTRVNADGGVDALWNVSEPEMDMGDPYWNTGQGTPAMWFQDGTRQSASIGAARIGLAPISQADDAVIAYYSQRGATSLTLLTPLLVPDVAAHYIKYGVLARCFGKDGEQKDPFRESYCRKRFEFGCFLLGSFMNVVEVVAARAGEVPPYSPLQLAPGKGLNALANR